MKMSKKAPVIAAIVGALTAWACIEITKAYSRQCNKKKEEQIKELVSSIEAVLNDVDVIDFKSFSEHLDEYYSIHAENMDIGEVIYTSPKFDCQISSNDIFLSCLGNDEQGYNLDDLEIAFESNRHITDNSETV